MRGLADAKLIGLRMSQIVTVGFSADSIVETKLSTPNAAYLYRYEGFRLLEHSGKQYFLMSEHWDGQNRRVFVLPDNHTMRIDFSRAN